MPNVLPTNIQVPANKYGRGAPHFQNGIMQIVPSYEAALPLSLKDFPQVFTMALGTVLNTGTKRTDKGERYRRTRPLNRTCRGNTRTLSGLQRLYRTGTRRLLNLQNMKHLQEHAAHISHLLLYTLQTLINANIIACRKVPISFVIMITCRFHDC